MAWHGALLQRELVQQQLGGCLLLDPGDDAPCLGPVKADHMREATVAASTGSERGHAALVGVVAVQVNVALGAVAEALLDAVRAGAAKARELRHAELPAELPAEPRHELRRGEAAEAVGQPG
jgi:hypothetical protein